MSTNRSPAWIVTGIAIGDLAAVHNAKGTKDFDHPIVKRTERIRHPPRRITDVCSRLILRYFEG